MLQRTVRVATSPSEALLRAADLIETWGQAKSPLVYGPKPGPHCPITAIHEVAASRNIAEEAVDMLHSRVGYVVQWNDSSDPATVVREMRAAAGVT